MPKTGNKKERIMLRVASGNYRTGDDNGNGNHNAVNMPNGNVNSVNDGNTNDPNNNPLGAVCVSAP